MAIRCVVHRSDWHPLAPICTGCVLTRFVCGTSIATALGDVLKACKRDCGTPIGVPGEHTRQKREKQERGSSHGGLVLCSADQVSLLHLEQAAALEKCILNKKARAPAKKWIMDSFNCKCAPICACRVRS